MTKAINAAVAAAQAGGGAIVQDALSYLGKIPYVWGGASLSSAGADCSGFTMAIYGKHGLAMDHSSESQGAWVQRTKTPQSGGLAFYHSPAGGSDPGHVAIIQDASTVISQGGGMGPTLMGINAMPLLWTGVPPGGFLGSKGPTTANVGSAQAIAQRLLAAYGWSGQWAAFNSLVNAESGWNVGATNPSSGAYGIPQSLPADKMASAGGDWRTNPATQLSWMMGYIRSTYGDPNGAWAHELGFHWYGGGGPILEPVAGVGLRSGAGYMFGESGPETVAPGLHLGDAGGGQALALLTRIADALDRLPHQTGAAVGAAVNGAASAAMSSAYYGGR